MNNSEVDKKLDQIALLQAVWKNQKLLTSCLLIANKACEKNVFWPDELNFDFLLTDDDRNVVGSAWRMCAKTLGIIEKTGSFKRSTSDSSHGRTIFQYKLIERNFALAFLRRYDLDKYRALCHPQLELKFQ